MDRGRCRFNISSSPGSSQEKTVNIQQPQIKNCFVILFYIQRRRQSEEWEFTTVMYTVNRSCWNMSLLIVVDCFKLPHLQSAWVDVWMWFSWFRRPLISLTSRDLCVASSRVWRGRWTLLVHATHRYDSRKLGISGLGGEECRNISRFSAKLKGHSVQNTVRITVLHELESVGKYFCLSSKYEAF